MISLQNRAIWIIAALAAVARALLFLGTDLYADEAYYWLWSTRPATGYFDHPPLVAWVAGLSSIVPGELGLRLLFVVCGALAVVFSAFTARELTKDKRAPAVAALLAATAPMLTITGALALPDAPQLAAYSAATWLAARAEGRVWVAVGLAWGLAMLAKYSSVLLGPGVLLAALVDPSLRAQLRTRWPWLGVLAATLVFLPCLAWNASHDFVSLAFQLRHGFDQPAARSHVGEFLGAVAGGAGPIVLVAGFAWFVRDRSSATRRVAFATVLPLLVTTYSSTKGAVEANWPAIAYPGLCAAAGALLVSLPRAGPILASVSAGLGVLVALAYGLELRFPRMIPANAPPIERFHGWREQALDLREACGGKDVFVSPSSYQIAAELAWYADMRRFGPTFARRSQFDVWNERARPGEPVCEIAYKQQQHAPAPKRVDAHFGGRIIRTLWVRRVVAPSTR